MKKPASCTTSLLERSAESSLQALGRAFDDVDQSIADQVQCVNDIVTVF
jgi:hypothetical protein